MASESKSALRPFGMKDKLGYMFGDFGNDFTFILSSLFLMKFYTDVMGVSAGVVGIVMMAARIVDAFTDLIMGKIMDNGKSPKGKCRPWFLRMAIPAFVAIVALFTVPAGLTGFAQVAYLFLSNVFLTAIVSTAIMIPYSAILVMRTKSLEERNKMGIFRAAAGYVIGMVIAIALVPLTNMLGSNGVADQAAYIKFAVVVGALSMIFLFILYKTSKETAAQEEKPDDGLAFGDAINKLFHNKYWVIVLLANLLVNVIYALSASSGTYYAKYILGNDNLIGIMGAVGLIPTFVGFIVVGPMTKKFGVTKTLKIAFVLGIIGNVIRCFKPDSFILCITVGLLGSFATIPMMCLGGTLNSMAMDYNDYKYHNKIIGMSASASSFGGKVSSGIGASLVGWILAVVGFTGNMEVITPAVRYGIYTFSLYIPLAMFVGLFILISKFDLEAKYGDMMKEIAERNEKEKAAQ